MTASQASLNICFIVTEHWTLLASSALFLPPKSIQYLNPFHAAFWLIIPYWYHTKLWFPYVGEKDLLGLFVEGICKENLYRI